MTSDTHARERESLGQLLKRTRISQGYDLEDICEETRISGSNLKAMEADDYGSLPADAFTRGFYTLYARKLKLDPDEIIARFKTERGVFPRKGTVSSHNPPAHKAAKQVSNMAEPTFGSPLSTIGYVLLLLIIVTGGLCWYFNINPATFISEKLRSFQEENATEPLPGEAEGKGQEPAPPENKDQDATASPPGTGGLTPAWNVEPFYAADTADTVRFNLDRARIPNIDSAS